MLRGTIGAPQRICRSGLALTPSKPSRCTAARATEDEEEAEIAKLENRGGSSKAMRERRKQRAGSIADQPFQVDSSVREALQGGKLSEAQVLEGNIIIVLTTIFAVCLLEGIIVGASGFFPDAVDQFVQDYVIKAFSPTIGLFLLCSSGYGLWKTRQDEKAP